jgi:hypothetical protein
MSNQIESTEEMTQSIAILAQDISSCETPMLVPRIVPNAVLQRNFQFLRSFRAPELPLSQEKHAEVVFECKICGKTYDNVNKGQFHETICEFRQSTGPEKLCWYCNNPCKTEYPKFICSRHGEYPDTDEEYDGAQNSGNSGARDERRNWKFLRRTAFGTNAGVSQDESYGPMRVLSEEESGNIADGPGGISPPYNWEELYVEYLAQQAEKEEDNYARMRWEADEEAYNATHCWYCDKQCASEEEQKCHESYCKTRDHGNYSDDE